MGTIAGGIVTWADRSFTELDPKLHQNFLKESEALGVTPPDILRRLMGRCVEIDHGVRDGVRCRSIYAHLSQATVSAGAAVEAGDPVGLVGNSGTSGGVRGTHDGAHLHLEVWFQRAGLAETYLGQGLHERHIRELLREVFRA